MEEFGRQIGVKVHWFNWTEDVKRGGGKWRVIEKMGGRGSDYRKGRECNLTITYLDK